MSGAIEARHERRDVASPVPKQPRQPPKMVVGCQKRVSDP
jgi:hypothetical protein